MGRERRGIKLIAILCWFDEPVRMLRDCIGSLALLRVDWLVAVDGAFALFPDAKASSGSEQHTAILDASQAAGIKSLIVEPRQPWQGNEIEKRTRSFQIAEMVSKPYEDWWLIVDADVLVVQGCNVKDQLEAIEDDAAELTLLEPALGPDGGEAKRWRSLFRAIPGLKVQHNHYTYVHPDGSWLWNGMGTHLLEQVPLVDLTIEHRSHLRSETRNKAKHRYYEALARSKAERTVYRTEV